MRGQDPMTGHDPRRTQDLMRTHDPRRTQDPMGTRALGGLIIL